MKTIQITRLALILLTLAFLNGCANLGVLKPQPDTTRFYFLETEPEGEAKTDFNNQGLAIVLGPSTVAKYLDQSQIVTLEGHNQLIYSDRNRWAEPLDESVNRLLIYQLARSLDTARISFSRMTGTFDYDYRIGYHIYELGGRLNETVQLKVAWWVLSRDGEKSHYDGSMYTEEVAGDSFEDYVNAIQAAIMDWSRDITRTVAEMDNQPSANSMSTSGSDPTSR